MFEKDLKMKDKIKWLVTQKALIGFIVWLAFIGILGCLTVAYPWYNLN